MSEFVLVLFLCPLLVLIASVIGYIIFRKWYFIPLVTLITFTILMFTYFNESFFIWVIIYTVISCIVSLIMKKFTS
ncbi:DUF2651 family protein [Neobacillus sp. K501]